MTLEQFHQQLLSQPESTSFDQTMAVIETFFQFTPTRFANGIGNDMLINEPENNQGSCKIFALGLFLKLDEATTLHCFGDFYRSDVLKHPQGIDHGNIRSFMRNGWAGIKFDRFPLEPVNPALH